MGASDNRKGGPQRRALLRTGGLAALGAAGAAFGSDALQHTGAAQAAPLTQTTTPLPGRLSVHIMRGLTLLSMVAVIRDKTFAERVQALALSEISDRVGKLLGAGQVSFTPNPDDICPPWWPWPFPWPPRRFGEVFDLPDIVSIPRTGLAALDMFRTLSLYNLAFQLGDSTQRGRVQSQALSDLRVQLGVLQQGGSLVGWEPGDGICPDWWPFPWPRPKGASLEPVPLPWVTLLDLARTTLQHNIAQRYTDTNALGKQVALGRRHVGELAGKLGGFRGGLVGWEPGDDICPPPWPWPWPWPGPLRDILDPVAGDPHPEPNLAIQATFELFRASTIFAIGSAVESQSLALGLRDLAIDQIQRQAAAL